MMKKIDFVLCWVDGSDPEWNKRRVSAQKELLPNGYADEVGDDNGTYRYREMGLLPYWFRSVEKFAPWVNKIYFITCGQKPEWLNENHPKLVLVNHEDYIPAAYLPTFNSNPIEMNLHRISGLSEHFVLFNDDMFLLKPVSSDFYFVEGLPNLSCNLSICDYFGYNNWSFVCFNDYVVINDNFDIHASIWESRRKWFSFKKLGLKSALKNLLCYKLNRTMSISGYEHLSLPHLKSTFEDAWNKCPEIMEETSRQRFRTRNQINHWMLCAWNQMKGSFYPCRPYSRGCHINISTQYLEGVCNIIKTQSQPQICLNDSEHNDNPELCFAEIRKAFETILPEKSSFEL